MYISIEIIALSWAWDVYLSLTDIHSRISRKRSEENPFNVHHASILVYDLRRRKETHCKVYVT